MSYHKFFMSYHGLNTGKKIDFTVIFKLTVLPENIKKNHKTRKKYINEKKTFKFVQNTYNFWSTLIY